MRLTFSAATLAAALALAACGEVPTTPAPDAALEQTTPGMLSASFQTDGQPPRPGCGYGDDNHDHQAAPGLDPLNLRPGKGTGDTNHPHTAPPGQAPDDGGAGTSVRRGCKANPQGR